MATLSRFQPYLEQGLSLFHQFSGPSMREDFLLAWIGLVVLGVALKNLRSWLSFASLLISFILYGSCIWLAGRFGFDAFVHTWRAGIIVTVLTALLAGAASTVVRRQDVSAPSVLGFILIPVLWPSRLGSYLTVIARLLHIIRDHPVTDDEPEPDAEAPPFDLYAENTPPAAAAPAPGPFKAKDSTPNPGSMQAAAELQETHQQLWSADFKTEDVHPGDFQHLNLRFYDSFRDTLKGYGFKHLGDIEVVSQKVPFVHPVMVRMMLSPEGALTASCFHCKAMFWLRALTFFTPARKLMNAQTMDFESEFNDGSFVITSNSRAVGNFNYPESINSESFPDRTVEELGSLHYQRVEAHANKRNCLPCVISSLAEAKGSQARLQAAKSSSRGPEGLSRDEFRRASGSSDRQTDELYDAWQTVRKQPAPSAPAAADY